MNTRTSLVALAALAAMATTALSSTSASAWGAGHFAEGTDKGAGYGGAPNPAATHPDPHVPGATVPPGGGMVSHVHFPLFPRHPGGSPGMPNQTPGTPPANGPNGQGPWTPGTPGGNQASTTPPSNGNGPNGWTPGSPGGRGPWSPGQVGSNQPCGYGGCGGGDGWHRWHRPFWGYGQGAYVPVQTYTTPVYTQAPVQTSVQAPVQTTYTTAPQTYAPPPVQTYASTPALPANCNCLTKSYAQDGSVLFADNCTKETAVAAPAGWQQGQAPQQQPHY